MTGKGDTSRPFSVDQDTYAVNHRNTFGDNTRDWTEDFLHDHGKYQHECIVCHTHFWGNRRRVWCRSCAHNQQELL